MRIKCNRPLARRMLLAAGAGFLAGAGPIRLAALDWSLIEVALGLGVIPAAATETSGYRQWVRQPVLPRETADLGLRVQPNLELLQMIRPDLILTIPDRADVAPALARIAPLMQLPIYTPRFDPFTQACDALHDLGSRLGLSAAAAAAVQAAERAIDSARNRLAGRDLPPVVVIRFVDPRTVFIFGAGGLFTQVMARMGVANGWNAPPNRWGFTQTSVVSLARLDPRSRVFFINPGLSPDIAAMMRTDPLWLGLPFVRRGSVEPMEPVWFFGAAASAARFATALAAALSSEPADAR